MSINQRLVSKYQEGKNILSGAKNELYLANKNRRLTGEDKQNREEVVLEEVSAKIKAIAGDLMIESIEKYAEEYRLFLKRLRGEKKAVEEVAAVKGHQYSSMSDDDLVRLLEKNFTDNGERGFILRCLDARLDAKEPAKPSGGGLENVTNPLQSKIERVISNNADRLTGVDATYLTDLREAAAVNNFAVNASTALQLDVGTVTGQQYQGVDIIKAHDSRAAADQFAQKTMLRK